MTEEQEHHRLRIVDMAAQLIFDKYEVGATEHKTDLKNDHTIEQLLDFAIEEAVDQIVYLLTIKEKLDG